MAVTESTDPRNSIALGLERYLTQEQVYHLIDEILSLEKMVSVQLTCTNCGKIHKDSIPIPDAKAVVAALTDLITQGYGRPGEAKLDDTTIVFNRLTKLEDDEPPEVS